MNENKQRVKKKKRIQKISLVRGEENPLSFQCFTFEEVSIIQLDAIIVSPNVPLRHRFT